MRTPEQMHEPNEQQIDLAGRLIKEWKASLTPADVENGQLSAAANEALRKILNGCLDSSPSDPLVRQNVEKALLTLLVTAPASVEQNSYDRAIDTIREGLAQLAY